MLGCFPFFFSCFFLDFALFGFLASWLLAFVFLESGLFGFWLVAILVSWLLAVWLYFLWPLWLWLSASSAAPVTLDFGWWLPTPPLLRRQRTPMNLHPP